MTVLCIYKNYLVEQTIYPEDMQTMCISLGEALPVNKVVCAKVRCQKTQQFECGENW